AGRQPALDQEGRIASLDERRIAAAAARERSEAQHQDSGGVLLPPPCGEYMTGNCATLPPSTFVILLTPCFSTSSIRKIECSGRYVRLTPWNSLLMRSSVGSTTTDERVPKTSFSTSTKPNSPP